MTIPNLGRKALVTILALLVFVSVSNIALGAPSPQDKKGGVRADGAQALHITVTLNGKPWPKASVVIKNADGKTVASAWTADDGTYTNNSLGVGAYTVTSSTVHYIASSNVTLVKSADAANVNHNLAKKSLAPITPPPPPPAK